MTQKPTEPPYTDPYVRWCGRGGAATLPPIPIAERDHDALGIELFRASHGGPCFGRPEYGSTETWTAVQMAIAEALVPKTEALLRCARNFDLPRTLR